MSKEGSLSLDARGSIIRFSQSLEEMLGYVAEEVVGRDFSCLAPAGTDGFGPMLLAAENEGAIPARKTGIRLRDGAVHEFYLSIHPLRDRAGTLYSFILNISSRKTGVPAVLNEEFRRFFRFSNDAVAVTDRDGSIMDVNQAFLDTYGYGRDEVLGRNPRILKSAHSSKAHYEKMWADILDPSKGYWTGEIINKAKDGREVPVLLSINAIKDPGGEIMNFLGIAFNMTRQKELDRLQKMYIDYVVHDIRGPLTSIVVNSELLLMQRSVMPEKDRKKIEVILSAAQKINTMATDMLDFSRVRGGASQLRKETFCLSQVIREISQPFVATGKAFVINGAEYGGGELPRCEMTADREKLQRALYNLLSNAFKHAASRVCLQVEHLPECCQFTVADDGRGIPPEEAERIFDAFYQADDGVKTGGAGLGLSIVKCFVEAHGGRVWVEPGRGPGAEFRFTIPS